MKTPFVIALITVCFACLLGVTASANVIQNGTFTSITYSGTLPITGGTYYGQFGTTPTSGSASLKVANWSTAGYNFVYTPGSADLGTSASGAPVGKPQEAPGQYNAPSGYGNTFLWGPQNGSTNGFSSTFPFAGNMIAADPVYETDAITQTITGLTVGRVYALHFYWGGMQQQSYDGATTEWWQVTFGAQVKTTGTVSLATHAFSGWQNQYMYFTPTSTTQTLSFLAGGTPSGLPPFSLLGGVEMEVVPESSNSMAFIGFGLACIVFESTRRRRLRKAGEPTVTATDP